MDVLPLVVSVVPIIPNPLMAVTVAAGLPSSCSSILRTVEALDLVRKDSALAALRRLLLFVLLDAEPALDDTSRSGEARYAVLTSDGVAGVTWTDVEGGGQASFADGVASSRAFLRSEAELDLLERLPCC